MKHHFVFLWIWQLAHEPLQSPKTLKKEHKTNVLFCSIIVFQSSEDPYLNLLCNTLLRQCPWKSLQTDLRVFYTRTQNHNLQPIGKSQMLQLHCYYQNVMSIFSYSSYLHLYRLLEDKVLSCTNQKLLPVT